MSKVGEGTTPLQAPSGSGMNIIPELDLRAVIVTGLTELASDDNALAELVKRVDALDQGSQNEWEADLMKAARDMLRGGSDEHARVLIGYPRTAAHLPCVSLVEEGSSEMEGEAVVGDFMGGKGASVNGVVERHDYYGTRERITLQASIWTPAPERSLLLAAMVKRALFIGRGKLMRSGVTDLTFSGGGFQPDPKMEPRVGYVPMIRISMSTTYRVTVRRRPAPNRYTLKPFTPS